GIQPDADFAVGAFDVPVHLGKRLAVSNGERAKAVLYGFFPKHLWAVGRPVQIRGLGANAVAMGSAILRPVRGARPQRTHTEHTNKYGNAFHKKLRILDGSTGSLGEQEQKLVQIGLSLGKQTASDPFGLTRAPKQSLHAQVIIQRRPMNAGSCSARFPLSQLLSRGLEKGGIPNQRRANNASIR